MHIWAVIEVIVNVAGNGAACERLMMAVRTEGISLIWRGVEASEL